ncbi:MAG: hypothetical protein ACYTHM_22435 [Planctomycetota bacterium]|jgi:hypothetical protein
MMKSRRFLIGFLCLAGLAFFLSACGKSGGMFDRYKKSRKGKKRIAYYEIWQPDVNYPDDDVLIWKTPGRNNRAFKLPPGTKVDVVETVDGDKYGSQHVMYKIKTADGRTGWVPKKWCKQYYK